MKRARDRRRHIFAIARPLRRAVFVVICALAGCISPYKQGAGKFDTVIIDAGHGGHDRGGRAISGSPEKALALDTARRLAAILRTERASASSKHEPTMFSYRWDRVWRVPTQRETRYS